MTIIMLLCAVVIFCLFCWIASVVPLPPGAPYLRNVLYIFIALVAIVFLMRFSGCTDLGLNHSIGLGHRVN